MEGFARSGKGRNLGRGLAVAALLLSLAVTGCTRRFYRNQADREVAHVLEEKDKYPVWQIENYHVYPDPRARFADPTNPDRPPMPPDDPAAWESAPRPQRPRKVMSVEGTGYLDMLAEWDAANRVEAAAEEARKRQEASGQPAPASPAGPGSGFAAQSDQTDAA